MKRKKVAYTTGNISYVMELTVDLPKEPNLSYLQKLMERICQTVGAPAGRPIKMITERSSGTCK
jgi:hypothetical protein